MITLVNKSKLVSDADVQMIVRACNYQLRYHVAPAWGKIAVPVVFAKDETSAPSGSWVLGILDTPTDAKSLGWHTESNGVFYGRVFVDPVLKNGGDALTHPLSVASVASHEICEIFCDPTCSFYSDCLDGSTEVALEVCDPVEADSYHIRVDTTNVTVSNFVFPQWFDPQSTASKLDYLGKCPGPFKMSPNGYMVVKSGGVVSQQFAERYPEWRKATKDSPLARTARRLGRSS